MKRHLRTSLAWAFLLALGLPAAGQVTLNPNIRLTNEPDYFTPFQGALYFTADDGVYGRQIWRLDRPGMLPVMLKDLRPGSPGGLGASANRLYFGAGYMQMGNQYYDLWQSDGTDAGTTSFSKQILTPMLAVGNTMFLRRGTIGEVWKTDGTPQGTKQTSIDGHVFSVVRGELYFIKQTVSGGAMGSPAISSQSIYKYMVLPGADWNQLIRTFDTYNSGLTTPQWDEWLVPAWEGFYFVRSLHKNIEVHWMDPDGNLTLLANAVRNTSFRLVPTSQRYYYITNGELWTGLRQPNTVQRIAAANTDDMIGETGDMMWGFGDKLVYLNEDSEHGIEPWISDGATTGTMLLKDIHPGPTSTAPGNRITVGGKFFFTVDGLALWVTDGTPQGTVLLKDFTGKAASLAHFTGCGNLLYFTSYSEAGGWIIWYTDGTPGSVWRAVGRNAARGAWRKYP